MKGGITVAQINSTMEQKIKDGVTISADSDSAAVVHIPALGMTLFQKIAE